MSKVQLFLVTYARDFEWAGYCLRSIQKYARGFSGVTVVVPWVDLDLFLPFEAMKTADGAPVQVKKYLEHPGKGMLHHEVMICSADILCPDADLIMHIDSDCLFHEPVTPEDYMVDGKPVLQMIRYDVFPPGRAEYIWQKNTMSALGWPRDYVEYETMQRHPAVHWRETYRGTRDRVEAAHCTRFEQFVLEQQNSYPQGFCEFTTLGAYALNKMRAQYHFEELKKPENGQLPKYSHRLVQFWSHSGRDAKDAELHRRQMDLVNKILS